MVVTTKKPITRNHACTHSRTQTNEKSMCSQIAFLFQRPSGASIDRPFDIIQYSTDTFRTYHRCCRITLKICLNINPFHFELVMWQSESERERSKFCALVRFCYQPHRIVVMFTCFWRFNVFSHTHLICIRSYCIRTFCAWVVCTKNDTVTNSARYSYIVCVCTCVARIVRHILVTLID